MAIQQTDGTVGGSGSTSFQLLVRARQGDPGAIERLFERLFPILTRWARGRIPRWARGSLDTADLVQEAFANAFRRLDHLEPRRGKALQHYLQQAIRNRVRDEVRRVGRRGATESIDDSRVDLGPSPFAMTQRQEESERYRLALSRLDADEQELLVARLELGCTYEQIALGTGRRSADAARMAIRRALLKLAAEVGAP